MKIQPPKRALQFLRWFCREDYLEEIEGDLVEVFEKGLKSSARKTKMKFVWSVIKYFRPQFMKSIKRNQHQTFFTMYKSYFKIGWRNITKNKSFSLLNSVGLATGLTCSVLIALWVQDEFSFDQFHENKDRLYQVMRHTPGPENTIETHPSNSVLLPEALVNELPDVEYVVPTRPAPPGVLSFSQKSIKGTGWFVGQDFFKIFSYRLIKGQRSSILTDKYSIVISGDLAIKLFGSIDDCLGKTIDWKLDHFGDAHIVTGVFETPQNNVSERFDFLVTYEAFLGKNRMDVNWNSNPIIVNLTLKPGTNEDEFNQKLNHLYKEKRGNEADDMFLKKYADIYLYGRYENGKLSGGRIDYVILFSIIACFILGIACINFMNLSTARASRRLKEVGIKKTIGVARKEIILQHLLESILIVLLSFIASLILVIILLPQFNLITGKHIELSPDWNLFIGGLVMVIITGLIAGSYPAFYLSGFRPVEILKGKLPTTFGEAWIRKGLVVFQFSISILLIVAVTVIYRQLDFVQSKNLGYNKNNMITFEKEGAIKDLGVFLDELKHIPGVVNASSMNGNITDINSTSWGHEWEGQFPGTSEIEFSGATIGYNFIETVGLKMKEGRSYSRDFGDENGTAILNEAAIKAMGMKSPIGKWIDLFGTKREIVGVVKDFHLRSMYHPIQPLFILCNPNYTNTILVRIEPGNESQTIERIDKLFHRYNPGLPFEINFVDDNYRSLYVSEQRVASLAKYFAGVAIIISCLGLFGMAAFNVEQRTKEIGIRKVLGASQVNIVRLLSFDFTLTVLVSILISLPFAMWAADYWLSKFAYRMDLNGLIFPGIGFLVLVIAWTTIGTQTIKAATTNPVKSLRSE